MGCESKSQELSKMLVGPLGIRSVLPETIVSLTNTNLLFLFYTLFIFLRFPQYYSYCILITLNLLIEKIGWNIK